MSKGRLSSETTLMSEKAVKKPASAAIRLPAHVAHDLHPFFTTIKVLNCVAPTFGSVKSIKRA